ncbi:hypothetical protein SAY86_027941 [Trapa natans]|uniref:Uncharacterized protein n=1 Tax=Trapa natans TaxID=22666 RepID=A0AAN7LYW3_TRANT|nr:hypothetical protein SAY86_027941 [Trapa natans]
MRESTCPAEQAGEAWEKSSQGDDFPSSSSIPETLYLERSCTSPGSADHSHQHNNHAGEKDPHMCVPLPRKEHLDISGLGPQHTYPYYILGVVNQVIVPTVQMYQRNIHDLQRKSMSSRTRPSVSSLASCMRRRPAWTSNSRPSS